MSKNSPGWPVADKRPRELIAHGHTRIDDYYWLRDDDRENPDVLAYLAAENDYLREQTRHLRSFEDALYRELVGRIKQDDESVPVVIDQYAYFSRYKKGKEYPIHLRKKVDSGEPEEILLDENILASGHDYYDLGDFEVSKNHNLLAYAEDTCSRGEYVIRICNLADGCTYEDKIERCFDSFTWANDNRTLYYIKLQEGTLIPYRLYRHRLGNDPACDELIHEEMDSQFLLSVEKSRDDQTIILTSTQTMSSEVWLADAYDPEADFRIFLAREDDHEYDVEPLGKTAYIRTNWQAKNFRLMKVGFSEPQDKSRWEEIIPGRSTIFLEDFIVFAQYIAVEERHEGVLKIRFMSHDGRKDVLIDEPEAAYTAEIDDNPNTATSVLRYSHESLATPTKIYDYDMATGDKVLQKEQEIPGGFDRENYDTRRVYAKARDGTSIPVTLLHRKGVTNDGTNPLFILGYGAYGISYDPDFRADRLSLVDRGFVFALAHIRGGQELGRDWYEHGKLKQKSNTFTDFIDVTETLVAERWGHKDKVVICGRSAGGLLMGAVLNMRPDLFRVAVVGVPFVDVVTTMLDDSIPLTTFEYDEWGDPRETPYYEYMLSYSPYDQIKARDYPHIWVGAGLWDPAVQYWEPAKWVARLRQTKTDDNRLLMYTDMDAGHRGASGRFRHQRDRAREYAFVFDVLGISE